MQFLSRMAASGSLKQETHSSEQHVSYLDPSTRGRELKLFFMRTFQKLCFHSAMKIYTISSPVLCSTVPCDQTLVLITPLQQVLSFDLRDTKCPTAHTALGVSSTQRAAVFHIAKYCLFICLLIFMPLLSSLFIFLPCRILQPLSLLYFISQFWHFDMLHAFTFCINAWNMNLIHLKSKMFLKLTNTLFLKE